MNGGRGERRRRRRIERRGRGNRRRRRRKPDRSEGNEGLVVWRVIRRQRQGNSRLEILEWNTMEHNEYIEREGRFVDDLEGRLDGDGQIRDQNVQRNQLDRSFAFLQLHALRSLLIRRDLDSLRVFEAPQRDLQNIHVHFAAAGVQLRGPHRWNYAARHDRSGEIVQRVVQRELNGVRQRDHGLDLEGQKLRLDLAEMRFPRFPDRFEQLVRGRSHALRFIDLL